MWLLQFLLVVSVIRSAVRGESDIRIPYKDAWLGPYVHIYVNILRINFQTKACFIIYNMYNICIAKTNTANVTILEVAVLSRLCKIGRMNEFMQHEPGLH